MIRRLNEIDLARIAPQPDELKQRNLERMQAGWPPFSYRPVRSCYEDIFNVQPPLFEKTEPSPWSVIREKIAKECTSQDESRQNLRVAEGLHNFSLSQNIKARSHDFYPLAIGISYKVTYWLNLILEIEGYPFVLFIDPRKSCSLTEQGRRFVFSMMHERIRVVDPDFHDVRLGIVHFDRQIKSGRIARLVTGDDVDLYSFAELEEMAKSTYDMWCNICENRAENAQRGFEGAGSLL